MGVLLRRTYSRERRDVDRARSHRARPTTCGTRAS
jgi:hypothetical protein